MSHEPMYDDDPRPLAGTERVAAAIAGALGLFGLGYALFSLAIQGFGVVMAYWYGVGLSGLAGPDLQGLQMVYGLAVGVVASIGAVVTSLLAMAASASALLGHRRRPLRWASAIIVVFDVCLYVLAPLVGLALSLAVSLQNVGGGGLGLFGVEVVIGGGLLLWSLGLVAFWIWCFTQMKEDWLGAPGALDP